MKQVFVNAQNDVRTFWRFLTFFAVTFLINIPLQLGLTEVLEKGLPRGYVSGFIFIMSIVVSLLLQIRYMDKSSFSKYGLKIDGKWSAEFMFGCLISVIQLSVFFLLVYTTGNLEVADYMVTASSDYSFFGGFMSELFQQMVASVSEEIILRSFLFYILFESAVRSNRNSFHSALIAWIGTSVLFGLGHMSNDNATILSTLNLIIDGLMICIPFVITGRLGMSIGIHFSWNVMQGAVLGLANSGYLAKSSLISSRMADNLFTGGLFGPEGSILLFVLDILAVLLVVFWKRHKRYEHWISPIIIGYAR